MSHTIIATKHGFILASHISGIVTNASMFDNYTDALSAFIRLTR